MTLLILSNLMTLANFLWPRLYLKITFSGILIEWLSDAAKKPEVIWAISYKVITLLKSFETYVDFIVDKYVQKGAKFHEITMTW